MRLYPLVYGGYLDDRCGPFGNHERVLAQLQVAAARWNVGAVALLGI
jgi:hypothetical protein